MWCFTNLHFSYYHGKAGPQPFLSSWGQPSSLSSYCALQQSRGLSWLLRNLFYSFGVNMTILGKKKRKFIDTGIFK
jgi:hypothetical protein